jgi:hypothetical protein
MKTKTSKQERLRQFLRDAYMAKEKLEVNEIWRAKLMECLRSVGHEASKPSYAIDFERLVWRLFPASFATSIGLAALLGWLHVTMEYNSLQLYVYYMETLTIKQIFGV